ncbi:MAG: DNA-binding response regulator [Sporomusaceae bacterium]|jgi:DNA-binding NarL/FixJ family response regulator|nr:DNA-binding response regulator [Sporomusaceae bacterium]
MGYIKADCVLPYALLAEVQQYIDGDYIYIPRKAENRKRWGERKNTREELDRRTRAILEQYQNGTAVAEKARQCFLSSKTVYKILSNNSIP